MMTSQKELDDERVRAEPSLQFFAFLHLPPHLQVVSQHFHALAHEIVRTLPKNAERTACLRKLMEAKDCGVRSVLFKLPGDGT